MKKVTIQLEYHVLDQIVIDYLKESYVNINNDILKLSDIDESELKTFEKKDIKYLLKTRKSLKRVLRYHMVHEDFLAFIEKF